MRAIDFIRMKKKKSILLIALNYDSYSKINIVQSYNTYLFDRECFLIFFKLKKKKQNWYAYSLVWWMVRLKSFIRHFSKRF